MPYSSAIDVIKFPFTLLKENKAISTTAASAALQLYLTVSICKYNHAHAETHSCHCIFLCFDQGRD